MLFSYSFINTNSIYLFFIFNFEYDFHISKFYFKTCRYWNVAMNEYDARALHEVQ